VFAQERQLHVLAQLGCRFFGHLLDVQDVLLVERETGHCLEVILDPCLIKGRGERAPIASGGGMRRSEEARVSEEAVRRKDGGGDPRELGMG